MKSLFIAAAMGLTVSSGHPLGLAMAVWMPIVCLSANSRATAFRNSAAYFIAALWPMVPGLVRYLGNSYVLASGIFLLAALLLSAPWALGSLSAALVITALPPLGLIGFASPLAGAGYWLPGTGWLGLIAIIATQTLFVSIPHRRSAIAVAFGAISLLANLTFTEPAKPSGWKAVNTSFGNVSSPVNRILALRSIQEQATSSSNRVLIFPESVAPNWSEAEWSRVIETSRARRQVLVIGATLSERLGLEPSAFQAALAVLHGDAPSIEVRPAAYDNAVQIRGAQTATFYQRIPVPLGMWRPFTHSGVPMRPLAPGVVTIDRQRAAILICYEQMLAWPILSSMLSHPTVIVGISNTRWFAGSPIPRYQASAVRSWAKLFGLPYVMAVNSESHEVETTNPAQSRSAQPIRPAR